jgi:signal transduction histidine kinase
VRLLLAPVIAWVVVRTLQIFELEHLLEVEDLNRQLQRLTRSAVTAQEEERRRISLELHDDTAQLLSSLLVRLKLLQGVQNLQDLGTRCTELMNLASEATESIRRMATQLRPVALDDLGLVAAIQWYIERFTKREGLQIQLKASGCADRIDPETELVVYRIVQESLRNVAKHAQASTVVISLERVDNKLKVTIKDDGIGFDPMAVRRSDTAGMGILGMSERAALVGGTVNIRSQQGSGTTVRVEIPLPAKTPAEAKEMIAT